MEINSMLTTFNRMTQYKIWIFLDTELFISSIILWVKGRVVYVSPFPRPGGRPSACYFEAASFSASYVLVHVTSSERWANRSEQRSSCTQGTETASGLLLLPFPPRFHCSLLPARKESRSVSIVCGWVAILLLFKLSSRWQLYREVIWYICLLFC